MLKLTQMLLVEPGALVLTALMIDKYCIVAVTSEAMDGAAPALNPGWVHRRNNSYNAVRPTQIFAASFIVLAAKGLLMSCK